MPDPAAKRLEIKKYANRRYYDATHSRHLTLEEIRSLVQQGYDISVVDAQTSTVITAQVLTQIILELDTSKIDSLPVPLLLRIIRMNDQLVKDFIEKYFNRALQSFLEYQRRVEEQIRQAHGLSASVPLVSAWTKAMFEPFSTALSGHPPSTPPGQQPGSTENVEELRQTVRTLQSQVEELRRHTHGENKPRKSRKGAPQK